MFRREKLGSVAVRLLFALLSPALALAAANQTPEQTSVEAAALNNQAVAAVEVRHYQEAIELLKQAIALQPGFTMAHYNLGRLYQSQDQFRLAIEAFTQAVRLNPAFADAHHHLGVSYNKIEHFEDAIMCFKRALQLEPNRAESLGALGFAYFKLGRDEEAAEFCQEAIRLKPDLTDAYSNLGLAYFRLGRRHCLLADVKLFSNCLVCQARGDKTKHFHFS